MQWCVTCDVREMNRSRLERKINKVEEIQNEQISRRIWICRIPSKLAICKRKNFFSIAQLIVFGRNTCSCSVNWSFLVHLQPAIVRNLGNIGYFVTRLGAERIWCWWYFLSMQMRSLDADMIRHDRKLKVGDWREIHLSVSILEVFDRSVQLWWREISTRSPQVMKTSCVFFSSCVFCRCPILVSGLSICHQKCKKMPMGLQVFLLISIWVTTCLSTTRPAILIRFQLPVLLSRILWFSGTENWDPKS